MIQRGISRRKFIKRSAAASAIYSLVPHTVLGANERVNMGVIGTGSMGGGHCGSFNKGGSRVIAVSDADLSRIGKVPGAVQHQDMRKLLEMKDIDAVVVATPNHWHSLAAIWSMQAGKHVYVEKPVSHNLFEGRQMVNAARRYNRVCQAGTQQRSCPAPQAVAKDIKAGKYGKVLWVHCSKLGSRQPIGKLTAPVKPPASVDYNLWAGPTPMAPIMRTKFHYDWHWQFNWGDGEMGNWGVHFLDDLRHMLGWNDVPTNVMSLGNRFWDDNGDTPNMQMALMEHRGVKVVVDIRNLPGVRGGKGGAVYLGSRGGNYIMCEKGYIKITRGGGAAFDLDGKRITNYKGNGGSTHRANFLEAVRSGDNSTLAAEIEVGHQSTAMCHLANIAWRLGKEMPVDQIRSLVNGHKDALNTIDSMQAQLEFNKIDLEKMPMLAGPRLTYDNVAERFTGEHADKANHYLRSAGRNEFVVPEKV
ncbi:MAG: Gfo/Idh/MocA family oxidoreductase [Kiritimatiellae bacterium]|jgi:predicted dehydrogenase|nr:Gfo/Idh/MocA family oxidoreductase [Kiritimatiellia bacterium]